MIKERLALVLCGPLRTSPHNIIGIDLPILTSSLVAVLGECTRIISGLGYAHHRSPPIFEGELEEVLRHAVSKAVGTSATFELDGVEPVLAEEWPCYPEDETRKVASPRITGSRDPGSRTLPSANTKVAGGARLQKRRPPPEWCAAYPPVFSSVMLTKPETLQAPREFVSLPKLTSLRPESWRWRHYKMLYPLPPFSPGGSWGFRPRYFRDSLLEVSRNF